MRVQSRDESATGKEVHDGPEKEEAEHQAETDNQDEHKQDSDDKNPIAPLRHGASEGVFLDDFVIPRV